MYFVSKNMVKFHRFINVPTWVLYSGYFLFLIIVVSLWFVCLYRPLLHYKERMIKQQNALQKLANQFENKHIQDPSDECFALQTELNKPTESFEQCIMSVFQLFAACNISLVSFSRSALQDKKWYNKNIVHYCMTSSFENLIKFFNQLCQSGLLVQCKTITINYLEDGKLQVSALFDFFETKNHVLKNLSEG